MRRTGVFALALLAAVLIGNELTLTLPVFGSGPDLMVLVVIAFSTGERPATAAIYGFFGGLFRDLLLTSPRGLSAFAYAVTAYAAGLVGEVRGVWALIALVSGSTFVSQVIYGLGTAVLSQADAMGALPRVAIATTAYNTLLAPLLIPVLRRFAAPERPSGIERGSVS